ncbi:MAG: hypothetical protein J6J01_09395 [Oscillospiraceae bacterium]|nr:hypothetical protein [Oscillospiraceae bacterium]
MSSFDYTAIAQIISNELGYHLFVDYGTLESKDAPYRKINEIITPIVGVFRINPAKLTALPYPYIGVGSATIDIPAPTDKAEDVRTALNDLAGRLHSTAWKIKQGDTTYSVVYTFETPIVGTRRRDVPAYAGEVIPVTQVMSITVVESGVSAFDVAVKINGLDVPLLNMMETRTAASETTPNADAKGEVTISQELYGVTLTTAAVENTLGDLLGEIVSDGNGNRAHAVEVVRAGVSKVYLMTVGTAGATAQPPNNVGYNLSLAESNGQSARFCGLWKSVEVKGAYVTRNLSDGVIFWGDGTGDRVKENASHTYLDGKNTHTVHYMTYVNTARWGSISKGDTLRGKRIRPAYDVIYTNSLPASVITMDSGDTLGVVGGRLTMTVDGHKYTMDRVSTDGNYTLSKPFVSLMRGSVTAINTDLLTYDRWSVGSEV